MDGWIRGDPIDVVVQTKLVSAADQHPELKLARTILPVTLPMHTGFYDGEDVYYVITDSSTQKYADEISQWQNYNVTAAPLLEETPETALGKVYLFKNGKVVRDFTDTNKKYFQEHQSSKCTAHCV